MHNLESDLNRLASNQLDSALLNFKHALLNKKEKISSSEDAYITGVHNIPKLIKSLLTDNEPSEFWAFEGSVGRGTWSRTPWVAVYDQRVTNRASDGFFIAFIISEDKKSVFLTLMNSSLKHYNYVPFRLKNTEVTKIFDFNLGQIPTKELSMSGKGTGPNFEQATLIWKKFNIDAEGLKTIESDFLKLAKYYMNLVDSVRDRIPLEKPFKANPFLIK